MFSHTGQYNCLATAFTSSSVIRPSAAALPRLCGRRTKRQNSDRGQQDQGEGE
jgi:hypothetical protein